MPYRRAYSIRGDREMNGYEYTWRKNVDTCYDGGELGLDSEFNGDGGDGESKREMV